MRILFLCHRLPFPPDRGGRIRPFNILKHLSRDHDVTLASLRRAADRTAGEVELPALANRRILVPTSELASWLRMIAQVPTLTPSSFAYFFSPRLARLVRRELRDAYDLVFAHSSSMAPYLVRARTPKVLDFGDMDSQKWLAYGRRKPIPAALGYRLEGWKTERAEARLAERFDLCTCATPAELDTLRAYGVARRTGWFPNGVDTEYFQPSPAPYDPESICFLGRMDYYPNQEAMRWFCREVFAPLRAQRPAMTLSIIGAAPPRSVRRLAEQPGVQVTGFVPDVRPHARRAAVSVAPLRIARGTQNKILECLAMGIPVVASPLAARGTQALPGEHLLAASHPREFIAAILRLVDDPRERRRLAEAGRARVLTHHDWSASMRRLDELIDSCLACRTRR